MKPNTCCVRGIGLSRQIFRIRGGEKASESTCFDIVSLNIYSPIIMSYGHVMYGVNNAHTYAHIKIVKINNRIINDFKMLLENDK